MHRASAGERQDRLEISEAASAAVLLVQCKHSIHFHLQCCYPMSSRWDTLMLVLSLSSGLELIVPLYNGTLGREDLAGTLRWRWYRYSAARASSTGVCSPSCTDQVSVSANIRNTVSIKFSLRASAVGS